MKAINVGPRGWIHFGDLSRDIPGRADPEELAKECWEYLVSVHGSERSTSAHRDMKTASELVSAKIRGSLRTELDSRSIIKRQRDTIDRLLAFVPTRAAAVPEDRLNEIVGRLAEWVVALFPAEGAPVIMLAEEAESDTKACHRITVSVSLHDSFDVGAFAPLAFQLHRQLAEVLTQDELQAIRLIVEPRSLPPR